MSRNIYIVSGYEDEQQLLGDDSLLEGKLTVQIASIGQDAKEQMEVKKHILTEIERMCLIFSKDQVSS